MSCFTDRKLPISDLRSSDVVITEVQADDPRLAFSDLPDNVPAPELLDTEDEEEVKTYDHKPDVKIQLSGKPRRFAHKRTGKLLRILPALHLSNARQETCLLIVIFSAHLQLHVQSPRRAAILRKCRTWPIPPRRHRKAPHAVRAPLKTCQI